MEEDQVNHIKKNIDRLTNLTTCNVSVITALQAKEMLSKAETQQLEIKVSLNISKKKIYLNIILKNDRFKKIHRAKRKEIFQQQANFTT